MAENNDKLKDYPLLNDPRAFSEQERNMIMKRIDKGDMEAASNAYNKKMGKIGVEAASKVAELGMYASGIGDAALIAKGGVTLAKSAPEIIKSAPKILETGAEVVKSAGAGITKAIEGGGELAASLGKSASKGVDYVAETGKSLFSKLKSRPKTAEEGIESTAKGALKNKAGKEVGEAVGEAEVSKTIGGKLAERAKSVLTKGKYVAEGYVLGEVIDKIGEYMNPKAQDDYDYGEDGGNVMSSGGGSGNGGDLIPYSNGEMIDGSSLVPDTFVHTGEYLGKDSSVLGGNKAESILQQILEQLREIKSINISMLTSLNRLVSLQSKMNENMQIMFAQQENRENATIIPGSPTRNHTPSRKQESSSPSLLSAVGGAAVAAGSSLMNAFRNDREEQEHKSYTPVGGKKFKEEEFGTGEGAQYTPSIIDKTLANLLERVSMGEGTAGEKGYSTTLGFGKYDPAWAKGKSLEDMSLSEVYKLQSDILKNSNNKLNSSAVGKYQIVRTTLFGERGSAENPEKGSIAEILKLQPGDKFSKEVQDQIGVALLKRRGLEKYKSGKISENQLLTNLSQEWASIANPQTGKALQHTGTTLEQITKAVRATKENVENSSSAPTKENAEKLAAAGPTKENAVKLVAAGPTKENAEKLAAIGLSKDTVEKIVTTKDTGFVLQPVKESLAERISQDTSMKSDLTPKTQVLQHSDDIKITAQNKQNAELMKVAMASNKSTQVIQQPIPMGEQRSTQPNIPNPRNITNGPLLDVLTSQYA